MSKRDIRHATMAELTAMRLAGKLYHNPDAPEGPPLGEDFWKNADVVHPDGRTVVRLELDRETVAFFQRQGRDHHARMSRVLIDHARSQGREAAE